MRPLAAASTVLLACVALACSGGGPTPTPSATTPTPPPTPTASSPASPTASPSPSLSPTPAPLPPDAWAAEVCAINAEYAQGLVDAQNSSPVPNPPELVPLQQMWAARRAHIEPAAAAAIARLDALTPPTGGEPFHAALRAEFSEQGAAEFFDAVAAAETAETIFGLDAQRTGRLLGALSNSLRSVPMLDQPLIDALAAITSGCRFFEFDARAAPQDRPTEDFSEIAIDDSFDADSAFSSGAFEDGSEVSVADGELAVTFPGGQGFHQVLTDSLGDALYHDARIEATIRNGGSGLAGLVCRSDGGSGYGVVVNPMGLILIYRFGQSQPLIGRAAAPDGFDAALGYHLAIECVRGNLDPLLIAVELDGVRIAEVLDNDPFASEGYVGMFTQWLAAGSETVFEDFKVTVKP